MYETKILFTYECCINLKTLEGRGFQGWLIQQISDIKVLGCLLWGFCVFPLKCQSPLKISPYMATSKVVNGWGMLQDELWLSPSYVEVLVCQNVTVFGDMPFKVVIELK